MSTKIGHFEILSELAKSATGVIYKANDPQTSQTVATAEGDAAGVGKNSGAVSIDGRYGKLLALSGDRIGIARYDKPV